MKKIIWGIVAIVVLAGAGYYFVIPRYTECCRGEQYDFSQSGNLEGLKAEINAATAQVPTQGDANKVIYLKVVDGIAYVLLAMDVDGWAGVSSAQSAVHPVVEKTLLGFSTIKAVKFGPAPGDTIQQIMKEYANQANNTTNTQNTNSVPVIKSITPSSGPIGTVVELKGTNLAGLEGDLDAMIANSAGETAFLAGIGSVPRTDGTIRVKIDAQVCKTNNTYTGAPCTSFLTITPGTYTLYTTPWGKMSNKVTFTVTGTSAASTKETKKTYVDSRFAFSVEYPSTWISSKGEESEGGGFHYTNFGKSNIYETPLVWIRVYPGQTALSEFTKYFKDISGTWSDTTVDGIPAKRLNNIDQNNRGIVLIAFVKNGFGYEIASTAFGQYGYVANEMASSLKFTN